MNARSLIISLAACCIGGIVQAETIRVPADAPSIQTAIDRSSPGDLILVAPRVWSERIVLKPGITLKSAGDDSPGKLGLKRAEDTIIEGGGANGDSPGVTMAEQATLDGFTVRNVGTYDDESWNHYFETHGNEQPHEHIGEFGTPGIAIIGTTCFVRHCVVHHIGDTGIAIRGTKDGFCAPHVEQNVCYRNMGGGIGIMAGACGIIRKNRCFENFYAGIGHDGSSPLVLENECFGNIRAGIGISEGACPVVRNNKCYSNQRAGIGIRTGDSTRPIVEQNECYENQMAGIGCDEQASPLIRDNHCHHNEQAGIGTQDHARPLIVENQIDSNRMSGIGVRGGADAVLLRNQCLGNELVAVGITEASKAILIGNRCEREGKVPPLVAIRQNSIAILFENQLKGGGVACLLVEGQGLLYDNDLRADQTDKGTGIWGWKGSSVTAVNNQLRDFKIAHKGSEISSTAIGNEFHQSSDPVISLQKSTTAPVVIGNTIHVQKPTEQTFDIEHSHRVIELNFVNPVEIPKSTAVPAP